MTTSTITLTDFLTARIDEDEAGARAAGVARHDPARVLADCKAKRRVVEMHAPHPHEQEMVYGTITACETCGSVDDSPVEWPCDTLRVLALPYADHPDYRDEWRP